jgi:RNA polymerase sigma-70 factor (ECF subfamily)
MSDLRNDEIFAELLAAQQGRLLAFIYALVHNLGDAEDIYQETAMALWRKFDQFVPNSNFGAWAREMARFEVLRFLKRKRSSRVVFDDELMEKLAGAQATLDVLDASTTSESYHHALLDCMARLNPTDRRLLGLCYSRETSLKSVAAQEGRSAPSICNSLKRIRGLLFTCIERSVSTDKDRNE